MKHKKYLTFETRFLLFVIYLTASLGFIACEPQKKILFETDEEKALRIETYLQLPLEARTKPENATGSFETANALKVALFASEPMVVNPTNIDIDEKGRVWVLESPDYSKPKNKQTKHQGRVAVLEDTDGDGKADKRTLFYQGEDVHQAIGIAVLGNKVYVTCSPDILVFTDEDGDDIPDNKEKLFTGMGRRGDHSSHALLFGPDGKFYWNMGNYGGPVKDVNENIIVDLAGNQVIQNGGKYLGGMVFRCNPNGSDFEVLAHNFRNNYEVTVDSYGNLWQSDNDDDGNKSVRVNFVMEYGNYGYLDEITREGWSAQRTNIEEEIPRRHWHQNDPGVVPNLLITGAGSPAGMAVYEGNLLPKVFHGQMIHADAGPNVVRSYPATKDGAGFTVSTVDIVKSKYDQWFRPVDVTVAPDGSVFIADWYDPGVGGGVAADFEKGRIFRVAPNVEEYSFAKTDISSVSGAIEALKSPNLSARYLGWMKLHAVGEEAETELLKLFNGSNQVFRARSLWLLGKIPGKAGEYIDLAIADENPDIRLTAIRVARQTGVDFLALASKLVNDPASEIRREIAIGLHLITSLEAAEIWSKLALKHDGNDRWYLEALGIGAANNWDACMDAWKEQVGDGWNTKAGKDIIWRSRAELTVPLLVELIKDNSIKKTERLRYFRAFDFLGLENKQQALLSLLEGDHPEQDNIRALALQHLNPDETGMSPQLRTAIEKTLNQVSGSQEYVNLVERYNLKNKASGLLGLCISKPGESVGINAARLLISQEFGRSEMLRKRMINSETDAIAILQCLENHGGLKESLRLMTEVIFGEGYSLETKKTAVIGLGKSWSGETSLLECVKNPNFNEELNGVAGSVLFNVYRAEIQAAAAEYLPQPGSLTGKPLPPIRNLIASVGNVAKGKEVFDTYCKTCHVTNGDGVDFGPKLSEIGSKLSKEGIYRAIMFPSEGVNYDYEGYLLTLNDGSSAMGIIESETPEFIELRMMGGIKNKYKISDITGKEENRESLMPNLSTAMSEEQLVNLVEFLSSLKKDSA